MKLPGGQPFSLAKDNHPVLGCTISSAVSEENGYYIYIFSLAADTDISPESYTYPKLWLTQEGDMTILLPDGELPLRTGDPKSLKGFRVIPLTKQAEQALKRMIANRKRPQVEEMISGHGGFILLSQRGKPQFPVVRDEFLKAMNEG